MRLLRLALIPTSLAFLFTTLPAYASGGSKEIAFTCTGTRSLSGVTTGMPVGLALSCFSGQISVSQNAFANGARKVWFQVCPANVQLNEGGCSRSALYETEFTGAGTKVFNFSQQPTNTRLKLVLGITY
jgi:hypothetical protein